jgi:hypothetical protein
MKSPKISAAQREKIFCHPVGIFAVIAGSCYLLPIIDSSMKKEK